MAEAHHIGFQDNLTPHSADPTHYPYIQFAYPTTALPQANPLPSTTLPAYYNQQGASLPQRQYCEYNPELRIKQTHFQPPSPDANQIFVLYQPPKNKITPNPNRVGSRVGTTVPVTSGQPISVPIYAQYIPPYKRENYDPQPVEQRPKEKKVAVAGALELTMNSRSAPAEHPRRYKDNDTGEFFCGKWGWILAALLFTALLTISLLFGLGILGGPTKTTTPAITPQGPSNAVPVQDNTLPVINEEKASNKVNQGKTSGKPNISGKNETSSVNGTGSTSGSASTDSAGQAKGQTTVTPLPPTQNNENYPRENATSTSPPIVPLVPVVLPPYQISTATNKLNRPPPLSTSTSSQNPISTQPTTTKTNQPSPSANTSTSTPTPTPTPTQPQTIYPTPATAATAAVTPINRPSLPNLMTANKSDTKVSGSSTPILPVSPTPSPSIAQATQNNSETTTIPTATPTTTPAINPNSVQPVPVGTPTTPPAPTTRPTPLPTPVLPPAPNYVGPAQYDFYPNYVLAQMAHQLSLLFHH